MPQYPGTLVPRYLGTKVPWLLPEIAYRGAHRRRAPGLAPVSGDTEPLVVATSMACQHVSQKMAELNDIMKDTLHVVTISGVTKQLSLISGRGGDLILERIC